MTAILTVCWTTGTIVNFEQKLRRIHRHSSGDVDKFNDDPDLLKKLMTGDESWVYGYKIETKTQ